MNLQALGAILHRRHDEWFRRSLELEDRLQAVAEDESVSLEDCLVAQANLRAEATRALEEAFRV